MKTLKISAIATVAMVIAWWFRLPHRVWPDHPYFADFIMALVLCIVLQMVWTDTRTESKKESR